MSQRRSTRDAFLTSLHTRAHGALLCIQNKKQKKRRLASARPTPRCRQNHRLFWSGRVNVAADQGRGDNNSQELSWTLSAAGNSLAAAPEPTRCLQSGSQSFLLEANEKSEALCPPSPPAGADTWCQLASSMKSLTASTRTF